jgi:uncharacterized membrane protein YwaF
MHSIFGTKHLIILAISLVAMVIGSLFARKWPIQKLAKTALGIGLVSEFIKVFYYIMANEATHGGALPKTDLPFHLCSIQLIFMAILVFSSNQKLKNLLLSFMIPSCLFGGVAALLIATTSSLNGGWILSVQYFGYHVAITVFAISLLLGKEFPLTVKSYVNCLKFLVVLMLFAVYINSMLYDGVSNINFMYVVSPPQSGLPFLTEKYGWLVYICHYAFTVLFFVTLCYIKPIVAAIKEKCSRKKVAA